MCCCFAIETKVADAGGDKKITYLDWSRATATVPSTLLKRDLLTWSNELAANAKTADVKTLIVSLEVFLRAGQPDRISDVIPLLGRHPEAGRPYGATAERLLRLGYYEQLRLWYDTFDMLCPYDGRMAPFVKWLVATRGAKGAEAWLRDTACRARASRRFLRFLYGHWSWIYWKHLASRGKLEAHVARLAAKIRQKPDDADRVLLYLAARRALPEAKRPPKAWLAKVARLDRALDNFVLARAFAFDGDYATAIHFFDRSLACPVVDYDRRWFNRASMCSLYVRPKEVESLLRRWTRGGLAKACFEARRLKRAQKLVEELTGKKDGTVKDLGPFLLAGQVQAATGKRVVAGRIAEAEKVKAGSVRYWVNRAGYYRGRKEPKQVEQAYKEAIKLPPDGWRSTVVKDYAWFLQRHDRHGEAERLYRAEIKRVGLKDANAGFWLVRLIGLNGKGGISIPWDEPLIWQWLAEQKKRDFGQAAQSRLEHVARRAGDWSAFEIKARALAAEPCPPALRYCLGRILYRKGQGAEGVRMMAEAYARWPKHTWPSRQQVGEQLLRASLAQGDMKTAENTLAGLKDDPLCGQHTEWLGAMAVTAARHNAADLAMRLWRRRAKLDLADQRGLDELAAKGLTARLRTFYSGLAKRASGNRAIVAALSRLKSK